MKHNYSRVLFVGTGGGNDVFSTLLAALELEHRDSGWQWDSADIAGVLSPFHRHDNTKEILPGCFLTSPESTRHLLTTGKQIGFIDATVAKLIADGVSENLAGRVLGLSLAQGTVGLAATFVELRKQYDMFVLVDVGGDIFYRGRDPHVLSPMFDAMVLKAFVDSGVPGVLWEAGPGTDGELEVKALEKALTSLKAERHPLHKLAMLAWQGLYERYIEPVRPGRTVPFTIKAFLSNTLYVEDTFRCRAHLDDYRLYWLFQQKISTLLCQNFYLINPKRAARYNPFAVSCTDPFDWFVKTQVEQHRTNCEANLEFLQYSGKLMQFLTPSPLFNSDKQLALFERAQRDLWEHSDRGAWTFPCYRGMLSNRFDTEEDRGLLKLLVR
jgi:hypothetical protein